MISLGCQVGKHMSAYRRKTRLLYKGKKKTKKYRFAACFCLFVMFVVFVIFAVFSQIHVLHSHPSNKKSFLYHYFSLLFFCLNCLVNLWSISRVVVPSFVSSSSSSSSSSLSFLRFCLRFFFSVTMWFVLSLSLLSR